MNHDDSRQKNDMQTGHVSRMLGKAKSIGRISHIGRNSGKASKAGKAGKSTSNSRGMHPLREDRTEPKNTNHNR